MKDRTKEAALMALRELVAEFEMDIEIDRLKAEVKRLKRRCRAGEELVNCYRNGYRPHPSSLQEFDKLREGGMIVEHKCEHHLPGFLKCTVEAEVKRLKALLDCRAGKLLKKGKRFVVVAVDEPYFSMVYGTIRQTEMQKGSWTPQCQADMDAAMAEWDRSMGQEGG